MAPTSFASFSEVRRDPSWRRCLRPVQVECVPWASSVKSWGSGDKPHVGTARVTLHKILRVTSTRSIMRGSNGIPDQAEGPKHGETPLPNNGVGCASAKDEMAQDGISVEVDLPPPTPPNCKPLAHGCAQQEMMSNALGGLGLSVLWVGWVFCFRVRKRGIDGGREGGTEGASKKRFWPSLEGALPAEGRCALNEVSISVDPPATWPPVEGCWLGTFNRRKVLRWGVGNWNSECLV